MDYAVTANLKHDGKQYQSGDTISLTDTDAAGLLDLGVISTDAWEETEDQAPIAEPEMKPEVAGKPLDTGEPSIDGRAPQRMVDNATDVTPELRALSPDVGGKPKSAKKAPKPTKKREPKSDYDPSANL